MRTARWTCKVCHDTGTDGPTGWRDHAARTRCDQVALHPSVVRRVPSISEADWARMSWAARQRAHRSPAWRIAAIRNRALLEQCIKRSGRHVRHAAASTIGATA